VEEWKDDWIKIKVEVASGWRLAWNFTILW
jgi:hypothetical protein